MVSYSMVLALVVLLGGRSVRSMSNVTASEIVPKESSRDLPGPEIIGSGESTDQTIETSIREILIDISNGIFPPDDTELVSLIKKAIVETAKSNSETIKTSIEVGAKQAQTFVTEITAAYTAAIYRANTAQDAQQILIRFQDTIQHIVDFAKNIPS